MMTGVSEKHKNVHVWVENEAEWSFYVALYKAYGRDLRKHKSLYLY